MRDDPTVAALAAARWEQWRAAITRRDDIALGALQRLQGEISSGVISKHHDWETTEHDHDFGAHALRAPGNTRVTTREAELLQLLADGHTLPSAASDLGIGLETAKTYARNLRRKLGARNTTHAVVLAMNEGVIR